jgi:hypothetical protein
MGGTGSTYGGNQKCVQNFGWKFLKEHTTQEKNSKVEIWEMGGCGLDSCGSRQGLVVGVL